MNDPLPPATGAEIVPASAQSGRGPSVARCAGVALAVALVGSTLLAVAELLASELLFGSGILRDWPWDLVAAALGRNLLTYLVVWTPAMLVCGLLYALLVRGRPGAAPEAPLTALFVLLAGVVVLLADLDMVHRLELELGIAAGFASLFAAAATYALGRWLSRGGGRGLRWTLAAATAVCGAAAGLVIVALVRSPLLNPGAFRAALPARAPSAGTRPNVLWVVLDTARADAFGCYGAAPGRTPFVDEFARGAIVFERAVANAMWTVPSHASMFTGLPLRTHGLGAVLMWLDDSTRTAAEALRAAGYATAMFTNNPLIGSTTNLPQGFQTLRVIHDFHYGTRFALSHLAMRFGLTPRLPWLDSDRGAALTNHLLARWLEQQADRPVLVFINYMEPHLSREVPQPYRRRFMSEAELHRSYDLRRRLYGELHEVLNDRANVDGDAFLTPLDRSTLVKQYQAAIRYLDERLRELMEILRARGLLENTLVILTSDHGEYLGAHGMWSHRLLLYDDLARVPLIVREPGRRRGQRVATPVQLSDLFATVVRTALGPQALEPTLHSRDLLGVAASGGEQRIAISEFPGADSSAAPRLIACPDPVRRHRASPQYAAVEGRLKYIRSADGTRELFDVIADPGELNNLAFAQWDDVQRLDQYIDWWLSITPAAKPPEKPPPDADKTLKLMRNLGYIGGND